MKKLIVLAFALALSACANKLPTLNLNSTVSLNTVEGVQAAYGTALSAERTYKSLPLCNTGTVATLLNPCAQRSIVVRLQGADLKAASAVRSMVNFINTYPTVDASNVIAAAGDAVTSLQSILNSNGV